MDKVLLTGATGYIGRHLINDLLTEGYLIRGLTRDPGPMPIEGVEWWTGDLRDKTSVSCAVDGCDVVVHLACSPMMQSWENPRRDFEVNVTGTFNIMLAARQMSVNRIVLASTAQVYGATIPPPQSEGDLPDPVTPYASSKLAGEVIFNGLSRAFGLNGIILRVFNVYGLSGVRINRNSVEETFIRRALSGDPLTLESPPSEGRDFIHIDDVVRAFRLALRSEILGCVFNIGTGVLTTIRELATYILNLTGRNVDVIQELVHREALQLQADIELAKRELDFEAEITLLQGLERMLVCIKAEQLVDTR